MFPKEILPNYVAYFSMEVGLDSSMPTYSGGLGVLAGDTLRAAADLGLPMIGVTLLHRKGYFRQSLDAGGNQTESPAG
jgi:starch phosphorylase